MNLYDDALAALRGFASPDDVQRRLREDYLGRLADGASTLFKPASPSHLTASMLVLSDDGARVLLTLHRKAGRWFQFGGHLEPDDATLAAAALREATEESGIADLRPLPGPVQLSRHPVPFCHPGEPIDHLDVRYVATVTSAAAPRVSAESRDVRWFDADALPTDEPDMITLVALARGRLRTH